jgi:plasmid stabilization system protein ParE
MARRFRLRARASDDIAEIVDTIAANHVDAAKQFLQTLQEEFDLLKDFSRRGTAREQSTASSARPSVLASSRLSQLPHSVSSNG